jgi:multidrug resistance efflux pump
VRAGEILATLDNRDLKLEQLKWSSQKEQYSKQYNVAMAQRNAAQVKITAAQVAQADAELALVEDQLARTHVRAPIDGVIVSGDLSQSIGAPAERGQVLFEVAPLDAYRVVLQVNEREAAEVAVGQRGKIALSAFPTRPLPFTVQKITPVSAAREGLNYFRVEAAMDQAPSQLRPGMEGVGKIDIAQRHLIWIWTHGAMDWLRLLVWSWWP